MNARIISGRAVAKAVHARLKPEVAELTGREIVPGLAVVLVGADPASAIYVRNKIRACEKVGIRSIAHRLQATTTQDELMTLVHNLNVDDEVDGILVQLPLPAHLDKDPVIAAIAEAKDVDGFGFGNLGALVAGQSTLVACTPLGVMEMLAEHCRETGFSLSGKRAVVLGRSVTVGKPMALLLLQANCTVTVCHSRTADLGHHLRDAEIVVAAVGQPELVRGEHLSPGAVVIDVGMHRRDDGTLCGDVHFESAAEVAAAISPVPGGVGPMTIAMLLQNTVTACRARRG